MISDYDIVNPLQFKGSLEKQGRYSTWLWRCYWFVLDDDQLCYYKDEQCRCAQGLIDMSRAKNVCLCKTITHGYAFEISVASRKHVLSAVSELSRDRWIRQLQHSMFLRGHKRRSDAMLTPSCNTISDAGSDNEDNGHPFDRMPALVPPIAEESGGSEHSGRRSQGSAGSRNVIAENDAVLVSVDGRSGSDGGDRDSIGSDANDDDGVANVVLKASSSDSLNNYLECGAYTDEGMSLSESVTSLTERHAVARSVSKQVPYADVLRPHGSYPFGASRTRCVGRGKSRICREPTNALPSTSEGDANGFVSSTTAVPELDDMLENRAKLGSRKTPLRSYYLGADSFCSPQPPLDDNEVDDDDVFAVTSPVSPVTPSPKLSTPPDPNLVIGTPIPDLPYPRLELTWGSAADQIRSYLASHRGSKELYHTPLPAELRGRAVKRLVGFLRRLSEDEVQKTSL